MAQPTRAALAICTPIPDEITPAGNVAHAMVSIDWHRARMSLAVPTNWNSIELFIDGEEVGDARNIAVQKILELPAPPTYLFFLDYDVLPAPDALTKLVYRASCFPEHDIFCGIYCSKGSPGEPLIYRENGHGPFWDWSIGDLLVGDTDATRITSCHMGLTLIRTSLFQRMDRSTPLFLTQGGTESKRDGTLKVRGTEDIYFCTRAVSEVGARILVDTSVLAGHQHYPSRITVGLPNDSPPVKRAEWLRFGQERKPYERCAKCGLMFSPPQAWRLPEVSDTWCSCQEEPKLKALDLGAGEFRRSWKGHKTYTTDLRADTKPDYVMDTRLLNLPDDSFDLIASSHHLEHIGRFDQEKVWSEIFRVCKPGGKIEHIVPNAIWAAAKIQEVEVGRDADGYEDAFNVLYGAQESHGYKRELNTHFFAYTPAIAKELAQAAGFTDVTTEDYFQNAANGYNLIIRGRKPNVGEEVTFERDAIDTGHVEENGKTKKPGRIRQVDPLIALSVVDLSGRTNGKKERCNQASIPLPVAEPMPPDGRDCAGVDVHRHRPKRQRLRNRSVGRAGEAPKPTISSIESNGHTNGKAKRKPKPTNRIKQARAMTRDDVESGLVKKFNLAFKPLKKSKRKAGA